MVILLQQKNFGPNVIYFALGITEGRPAGAFWADKIAFWTGKASRRGLLGRQNCVLPESRPAGAFWADKIVTQGGVLVLGGTPGSFAYNLKAEASYGSCLFVQKMTN